MDDPAVRETQWKQCREVNMKFISHKHKYIITGNSLYAKLTGCFHIHEFPLLSCASSGWQWYYRRYIDVRKGGVGGLGMLLAGYCVLSYVWSYPHISK